MPYFTRSAIPFSPCKHPTAAHFERVRPPYQQEANANLKHATIMKEDKNEVSPESQNVKPKRKGGFRDLTGQTFGRLTVVKEAPAGKHSNTRWECRCICDEIRIVSSNNLRSGTSTSCGCLSRELTIQRSTKHGGSGGKHPLYKTWDGIKQRCLNKADHNYPGYGGRGIIICSQWVADFTVFVEDMGPRPSLSHSVERINNDGPYSPDNCKWATRLEQCNNRRDNLHITHNGRTQTLSQWAREYGVQGQTIIYRIRNGWPIEEALTTKTAGSKDPAV